MLAGYNDMWTTAPELAKYLSNPDDGYKYTKSSNQYLEWTCPNCNHTFIKQPNKMSVAITKCQYCNLEKSYSEKFLIAFLEQCNVDFEVEKIFSWSDKKRYDFYVPKFNLIIETHGKQHYMKAFMYKESRTLEEEKQNDLLKEKLAKDSGIINHYVVLDCRNGNKEWVMQSILDSILKKIFNNIIDDIDWDLCDKLAVSSDTKRICEAYENGEKDIKKLCKLFHLSKYSLRERLKFGAKYGWCQYNPAVAIKNAHIKTGEYVVKNLSKPVLQIDDKNNIINEFNSLQEAQRTLKVSHIWDCIVGRRKSAGGYKWKYKEAA